jgi:hypothetical protein
MSGGVVLGRLRGSAIYPALQGEVEVSTKDAVWLFLLLQPGGEGAGDEGALRC